MEATVLGASGIGKHHVKWLKILGLRVTSFLGSSKDSIQKTQKMLFELYGLRCTGYLNLSELIEIERPTIAIVSTPPSKHYQHVKELITNKIHVLCEKPFIWYDDVNVDIILNQTKELITEAKKKGVYLSVNAQYAAALGQYNILLKKAGLTSKDHQHFFFELDTMNGPDKIDGLHLIHDELPHALAMLSKEYPFGSIIQSSVKVKHKTNYGQLTFDFVNKKTKRVISCTLEGRKVTSPPLNRRFGFDTNIATFQGEKNEMGDYKITLKINNVIHQTDDFIQQSIQRFIQSVASNDKKNLLINTNELLHLMELQCVLQKAIYN